MSLQTAVTSRKGSVIGPISHVACPWRTDRTGRAAAAVRAAAARVGHDPSGLSSLRFGKPTPADMEVLMQEWQGRQCNHAHAGASASAPDLPAEVKGGGFMVTTGRRKVGQGRAAYDAAVRAVQSWQHLQLGWNCTTEPAQQVGAVICSATQTVVPWSVLPAQVTYCREEAAAFGPGDEGRRFVLGLCSLNGHQLAGEERFCVELHGDGSVFYDIFLFSKPDTLLAWASLPVVKLQQVRYVNDGLTAVEAAVKGA
ncbi:hypothetical protein ABPG77_000745 [Micractinium sp. CCAP 211/92]